MHEIGPKIPAGKDGRRRIGVTIRQRGEIVYARVNRRNADLQPRMAQTAEVSTCEIMVGVGPASQGRMSKAWQLGRRSGVGLISA